MKKIFAFSLVVILTSSCQMRWNKSIKGNGHLATESRDIGTVHKIKIRGPIDVELTPGNTALKVEADENLMNYIITEKEDGWLVVKTKNNYNLKTNHRIIVYVSTDMIESVHIQGSGNVKGEGKFNGGSKLDIDIAGSGNVDIEVNTPKIDVDIKGNGSVVLAGETRNATVEIKGSGDYQAIDLLTETTNIDIMGSGDAKVFADENLNAEIKGSGSVYYKGKGMVRTDIKGSGTVKRIE
jgi:hypothetical protein